MFTDCLQIGLEGPREADCLYCKVVKAVWVSRFNQLLYIHMCVCVCVCVIFYLISRYMQPEGP